MNTSLSHQICALSKSYYCHICELRCLRPYLDFKTASTIATSIVHSQLDYCNSLYYNLPQSQIKRLQNIQNSLARAVTRMTKSSHITPVLKSLHWLKINERIKYKLFSLTYKVLTINQPRYLQLDVCSTLSLTTHVLHLWSLLFVHLPGPLWKSLIALFSVLHIVYGTNSPLIFENLVRYSLLHFHMSLSPIRQHHLHYLHYHHLHLLLLS